MTTIPTQDKPVCPCCGGNGMHYYRAVIGAARPSDDDAECSLCAGTGHTWFESRPNGCSGYRELLRGHR